LTLILRVVDSTKYNQRYDSISAWDKIKSKITKRNPGHDSNGFSLALML